MQVKLRIGFCSCCAQYRMVARFTCQTTGFWNCRDGTSVHDENSEDMGAKSIGLVDLRLHMRRCDDVQWLWAVVAAPPRLCAKAPTSGHAQYVRSTPTMPTIKAEHCKRLGILDVAQPIKAEL